MAKLKDSRVYGNLDIDSVLTVSSDTTINGNLTVTGNTIYSYVDTMKITDPLIELGGADSGALASNDGKDRGSLLHYYNGAAKDAFMGWDNSAGEFALGSDVTVSGEVVSYNTYGNLRAGTFFGNAAGLTNIVGANVDGTVAYANMSSYAGLVTASSQPNITSVGTLVDLSVTGDADIGGDLSVTGTSTLTGDTDITGNATVGGNLTVTGTIYANVSGSLAAPGSNTYILFNDGGAVNAISGFTFNKSTHALTLSGDITGDTITGNAFSGNGAGLSSITGANVTGYVPDADHATIANVANVAYSVAGGNVSGEVVNANTVTNPAQGNITSVGTLTSLTVSGNIAGGNIESGGVLSVTGNANVGNLGATAGVFTGTLSVTGNANTGNLGTGAVVATGNVDGANFNTTGTANIGNLKIAGQVNGNLIPDANVTYNLGNASNRWKDLYLAGNTIYLGDQIIESNLTALTTTADFAANNVIASANVISGNVYANSGTVKATTLEGTLSTAAQPNVTSLGNLTVANVVGNLQTGGILTDNYYYANGAPVDFQQAAGSNTQLQFNNNGDFGSSANLTYNSASQGGGGLLDVGFSANGLVKTDSIIVTGAANVGSLNATGNANVTGNISGAAISVTGIADSGSITTGDIDASGDVSVTGNIDTPKLTTADIVATTADITISASDTNGNVVLAPTGTGTVDVSNKRITSVATPDASSDAANKGYVDGVAQGLSVKISAHSATTAALDATYDNGTDGAGATLTFATTISSIDTHAVEINQRILVKDQADAWENGIYDITQVSPVLILTRSLDMNKTSEVKGAFVFVAEGATNQNTGWTVAATSDTFTAMGATDGSGDIDFTQFSGAGAYSAGSGLTLTGTDFSVNVDESTLTIVADTLQVKDGLTLVTPNIGAATGTSLETTGNITIGGDANVVGNLYIGGVTIGNGSISAPNFIGNVVGDVSGNISGNITVGGVAGALQFVGAGNTLAHDNNFTYVSGTLTVDNIAANTVAGSLTTSAQPNITSVGNLESLAVTGNISSANANLGNLVIANYFQGNGSALSSITGANVTGTVANATYATTAGTAYSVSGGNVSGDVSGANHANIADVAYSVDGGNVNGQVGNALVAGTVYTAAQPNITSVGTLSSLSVTANVSTGGIKTDNYYYANGTPIDFQSAAGNATEIQFKSSAGDDLAASANFTFNSTTNVLTVTGNISGANVISATTVDADNLGGTLTTATQTNIRTVGTLTGLTVDGTSNLGPVGNVVITGGSDGQFLKTDGTGSLSWATVDTSIISNGTSNVSVALNGNISLSVGGSQIIAVTGTGANVTGAINATGNVTANNITAANVIVASGDIATTSAVTGTVKVAGGMSATGNIYTGKAVGFANNNGGTDSAAYIQFNASANSLDFIFN